MKFLFENWREYREDILNELMPDSMDPAVPSIMDAEDAEKEGRRLKKKYYDQTVKKHSAFRQRTVKGKDPEAPPVKISGVPGGDESYGTGDPEALDAARQELKGTRGRGRGDLYSDEELDTAQMAGEIGLMPAEAAIAGGLAGAQAAAYATPAAAALAAGEVAVAAAESPYIARPGRAEQYRPQADKNLATYFRSQRIQRKADPKLQSKASLLKDLEGIKKYIQKTASGNIIIRGGGSKGATNAADKTKLSGLLASEIKANFLDIRKRLLALKKKPSTITPKVREKLVAQAKKLGIDPKKYMAKMKPQRKRRKYDLAALEENYKKGTKMKVTKLQLQYLIKEEYKKILFKESIMRLIDLTNEFKRLGRGFRMAAKDVSVVEELINTRQINIEDLPQGFAEKFREAGGGIKGADTLTARGAQQASRGAQQARKLHPNAENLQRLDAFRYNDDYVYVIVNTSEGPIPFYKSTGSSEIKGETGWLPFFGLNNKSEFMKLKDAHPQARQGWRSDRDGKIKHGKYTTEGSEFHDIGKAIEKQGWNTGVEGGGWDSPADFLSNNMPSLQSGVSIKDINIQLNKGLTSMGKKPLNRQQLQNVATNLHMKLNGVDCCTGKLTHMSGGGHAVPGVSMVIDQKTLVQALEAGKQMRESTQRIKLKIILG